ncbi:Retrotransposon-derived protein PEG10 [Anabarilius grahami]|uniref:Retrotransposon-derived protein PEG10 n=1 Tax=Anabarilius grahami TaxID=495550 RepID=A0A3N0YGP5_ANAGA|nr:Retrotransposon-derived protein PEG10 [Anabarilius grahami]
MVSVILPTLNHQNPLTIVANLTAADVCIPVNAFIDSGSAGNFISGALCRQLNLKTVSSPKIYQIHAVTGRPLRQVRHMVGPLRLQIGVLHQEDIHLLVLEDSTSDVILGRPWLEQHDPNISWRTGDVLKWVIIILDMYYVCDIIESKAHLDPVYSTLRFGTSLANTSRSSFGSFCESPTQSLVDTTGLRWREAIIRCLESITTRSRTQPDPEPESPPSTVEYSCVPTADGDLPPAAIINTFCELYYRPFGL